MSLYKNGLIGLQKQWIISKIVNRFQNGKGDSIGSKDLKEYIQEEDMPYRFRRNLKKTFTTPDME